MTNPLHAIKSIFTEYHYFSLYTLTVVLFTDIFSTLHYKINITSLTFTDFKNMEPGHLIFGFLLFCITIQFLPALKEYIFSFSSKYTKNNIKTVKDLHELQIFAAENNNQTVLSIYNNEINKFRKFESYQDTAACCIILFTVDIFTNNSTIQQGAVALISGSMSTLQRIVIAAISFYTIAVLYFIFIAHERFSYIKVSDIKARTHDPQ